MFTYYTCSANIYITLYIHLVRLTFPSIKNQINAGHTLLSEFLDTKFVWDNEKVCDECFVHEKCRHEHIDKDLPPPPFPSKHEMLSKKISHCKVCIVWIRVCERKVELGWATLCR